MSGWDGLIEIFQPGYRYLAEEQQRKRIEAQIPGNSGDPNRSWVDLDKGIVHIVVAEDASDTAPVAEEREDHPEPDAT